MYRTYASLTVTLPRQEDGSWYQDSGWVNQTAAEVWEHIKVMQKMYGAPTVVRTTGNRTRYVWDRTIGTGAHLTDSFVYVRPDRLG